MQIEIVNQTAYPMPRKSLIEWLARAVDILILKRAMNAKRLSRQMDLVLTIVFVDSKQVRRLNKQYRGKDKITDVLSFSAQGRFPGERLGEVVICREVAKTQAKQNGHSLKREIFYLSLHGLLHLLGYDHENREVRSQEMFRLQDHIFDRLN